MNNRDGSREDGEPPSSGLTVFFTIDNDVDGSMVPSENSIHHWVSHALQSLPSVEEQVEYETSVSVVSEETITELNLKYRGKNNPTNVLSFPSGMPVIPASDSIAAHQAMGDVVICHSVLQKESEMQGKPLRDHWAHMLVHSILHLSGYDHEHPEEAENMEALEVKLLAALSIPNPYQPSVQVS